MKKKIRIFFYILIATAISIYTYKLFNNIDLELNHDKFISLFSSNDKTKIVNEVLASIYQKNKISLLLNNQSHLKDNDLSITKVVSDPIVYIYNTHQQEQYNGEQLGNYNIDLTVLTASYILQEYLKQNNIESIVEETNMQKLLNKNNYSYDKSYQLSRKLMLDAKKKHNSIIYYIDIHRDSVSGNTSTIKVNDQSYARPMFVIGINNKHYEKNLNILKKLEVGFDNFNQNLSRGIFKRNSIYNQDLSPNVMLIEIGGLDNTLEEIYNTTCLFGEILVSYIGENNG